MADHDQTTECGWGDNCCGGDPRGCGQQTEFPTWWHHDPVEILAVAMEESFFARHELPVSRALHAKFRQASRAAIGVLKSES